MDPTRFCPKCTKWTIIEKDPAIYMANPPKRRVRDWCACGWRGEWRTIVFPAVVTLQTRWDRLNP